LWIDELTTATNYENHEIPDATAEHDIYMPDAANCKKKCEYHRCSLVRIVAIRIAGHLG
jgi:hypothetical protein